ncbi:hypothetical protein NHX12_019355 [Muraenolepis orangiensis]|uniref:Vestigial n=1 Tax=Muraenolepis orangiensis TaxID=630683 RepID=A0A9Q0ETJ3_9TELE|nr:hypothetical protein NHX12_019355 [Muraenolepis orangiensis]
MSCLDVMYPAYGHYAAPYAPPASAFIHNSIPAPISLSSASHCRDFMDAHSRGPAAAVSGGPGPKDKQEAPDAEYLTSRCVLFTYYHGDISSVVDQHFSRALSSYMDGEEAPSPGSRRSFPPSFWDSNYCPPQPRPHCEAGAYSMDPYASGLHPGLSQAYGPPRPLHELYSPAALEPHYGPLLMPTVRPPHLSSLPGPYEVSKLEPGSSWPGLLAPGDVSQSLALNMDPGLQHHKKGKELYWF